MRNLRIVKIEFNMINIEVKNNNSLNLIQI